MTKGKGYLTNPSNKDPILFEMITIAALWCVVLNRYNNEGFYRASVSILSIDLSILN